MHDGAYKLPHPGARPISCLEQRVLQQLNAIFLASCYQIHKRDTSTVTAELLCLNGHIQIFWIFGIFQSSKGLMSMSKRLHPYSEIPTGKLYAT